MSIIAFLKNAKAAAILDAVHKSQAIIEFDSTGKILNANENFCRVTGYSLTEIVGQHHRIFVRPEDAKSAEYKSFWSTLAAGNFSSGQFQRVGKGGKELWLEASYNPVANGGKVTSVVKIATDITEIKRWNLEGEGKLAAIGRAQAMVEFTPEGRILAANENFLEAMGYDLSEIVGRHHSMFCEPAYAKTAEYQEFWRSLARGEFAADEFKRLANGRREVFIQASYNPIFDTNGAVFKVVKFATDVTSRVVAVNALGEGLKSLAGGDLMATIETPFVPTLDGLRLDYNESILKLRETMALVLESAGRIAAGTAAMQEASRDLAQRTENQASVVGQTVTAFDQINTAIANTSRQAAEAGVLVGETRKSAEQSAEVLNSTVDAMTRIKASSSQIASIVTVIDDIAFQTNLLALNAGVEAARAGDAGRGFAVVAQEVRELAQRSAKAAKEIKGLISVSEDHVNNGVALVGQTADALIKIADQVAKVDSNVSAIVMAAAEQSAGLGKINGGISSLDRNTQANAAMVKESNAASAQLSDDAASLFDTVSRFDVGTPKAVDRAPRTKMSRPSTSADTIAQQKRRLQRAFNSSR